MIRFYTEKDEIQYGLSVYHPSLYKRSIGFILNIPTRAKRGIFFKFRIATSTNRLWLEFKRYEKIPNPNLIEDDWLGEEITKFHTNKTFSIPYWKHKKNA